MKSLLRLAPLLIPVLVASLVAAQPDSGSTGLVEPGNMSQEALVRRIESFEKMLDERKGSARQAAIRVMLWEETIKHVDALLTRFDNSPFKEQATATKLKALAELARSDQARLGQLLELTAKITGQDPGPRLASENAYYSIQGFVLGARLEEMPPRKLASGTRERYEAYLQNHPRSERAPVIRASLIRNLLASDQVDRARRELAVLRRDHPDHRATKRATGELYRVDAVGKPFAFDHTTSDGRTIRSRDHLGKVLVVHFWATWSQASRNDLLRLIELHRKHEASGLQLIGVNVDRSREQIGKALDTFNMSWPQYFDEKGLDNDAFVSLGVLSVPIYFVVDRRGILRGIAGGDDLPKLIETLLAEPGEKE